MYRHVGKQGVRLKDNPKIPLLRDNIIDHVTVIDDISGSLLFKSGNHSQ